MHQWNEIENAEIEPYKEDLTTFLEKYKGNSLCRNNLAKHSAGTNDYVYAKKQV